MRKINSIGIVLRFKNINKKGFTLIELIGVIVLLAIIMGIGTYSVVEILKNYKNKSYDLLVENIKSAVEDYYIECRSYGSSINCPIENSGWYQIKLDDLVKYGFLKGNSTDDGEDFVLVNPKDNVEINECLIKYSYSGGKINIESVNPVGSCPASY